MEEGILAQHFKGPMKFSADWDGCQDGRDDILSLYAAVLGCNIPRTTSTK